MVRNAGAWKAARFLVYLTERERLPAIHTHQHVLASTDTGTGEDRNTGEDIEAVWQDKTAQYI